MKNRARTIAARGQPFSPARAERLEEALLGIASLADRMRGGRGRALEQQSRNLIAHVARVRAELTEER